MYTARGQSGGTRLNLTRPLFPEFSASHTLDPSQAHTDPLHGRSETAEIVKNV